MTRVAFWKTHSGHRVEDALGWRRAKLEAGRPSGRLLEADKRLTLACSSTLAGPASPWKADEGWFPIVLLRGLVCVRFQASPEPNAMHAFLH